LLDFSGVPTLEFNGQDGRDFRVLMMARDTSRPTLVREVALDAAGNGFYAFSEALAYGEVIVAVANVTPTSAATYSYMIGDVVTDVPATPSRALALRCYPNPFNPACRIAYALPGERHVKVDIYDLQGHHVRSLIDQRQSAGEWSVRWDGTDWRGRPLISGAYFCRIAADDVTGSQMLMLVK
jgi:hypothetical protein